MNFFDKNKALIQNIIIISDKMNTNLNTQKSSYQLILCSLEKQLLQLDKIRSM